MEIAEGKSTEEAGFGGTGEHQLGDDRKDEQGRDGLREGHRPDL